VLLARRWSGFAISLCKRRTTTELQGAPIRRVASDTRELLIVVRQICLAFEQAFGHGVIASTGIELSAIRIRMVIRGDCAQAASTDPGHGSF
jgi:hypothetical protein